VSSVFSFLALLSKLSLTVNLSVSKLRSLERGGVSELSQAQVDRRAEEQTKEAAIGPQGLRT